MKINRIMDYNSNLINNKKDTNSHNFSGSKITQFKKYRTKILTLSNTTLKKNLYNLKNSLKKFQNKNHLNIKNLKFPHLNSISNINNNIQNIYLSNSSPNFYISQKTEKNELNKNKKNIPNKSPIYNNIFIKNNNFDSNYTDNNNVENKNKKFMRKIDLELNDILNNNKLYLKEKLKGNNTDINNIKKNDKIIFNMINYNKNNYKEETKNINDNINNNINTENIIKIKKNKSEKIFQNFSRKVEYINQKNNFISEKKTINLIQNEEKNLNNNFSYSLLNKHQKKNIIKKR